MLLGKKLWKNGLFESKRKASYFRRYADNRHFGQVCVFLLNFPLLNNKRRPALLFVAMF